MQRHFSIHGVTLEIKSASAAYLTFTDMYFKGFESQPTATPAVSVEVLFPAGYTWNLSQKHVDTDTMYGTGISFNDSTRTTTIAEREWNTTVHIDGDTVRATLSYTKNFWRHTLNTLLFGRTEIRRRIFRGATRHTPQTLVFQKLATRGIYMHAGAAVTLGTKTFILSGLPGAGKSILAHALRRKANAQILTENFALTDGTSVFPFPEGNSVASLAPTPLSGVAIISHGAAHAATPLSIEKGFAFMTSVDLMTGELISQSKLAILERTQSLSIPASSLIRTVYVDVTTGTDIDPTVAYFSQL